MSLHEELEAIVRSAVADVLDARLSAMAPEKTPRLLTREEAAALLRVTPRQLDLLRKSAKPPPELRVGDSPRFLASELIEWARERAE